MMQLQMAGSVIDTLGVMVCRRPTSPPDGEIITFGSKTLPLRGSGVLADDQRAPRQHHRCWRQTLPSRGSVVPAELPASGSHVTSFQRNMECDVSIRKNVYVNVVLSTRKGLLATGTKERHPGKGPKNLSRKKPGWGPQYP